MRFIAPGHGKIEYEIKSIEGSWVGLLNVTKNQYIEISLDALKKFVVIDGSRNN